MPIGLNIADLKQGEGEYAIIIRLGILFLCFAVMLIVASSIAVVLSGYFEKDTRWYYLSQNICQCAVGF
ncbi:MAG: hypothetical protein K2K29_05000, partial [Muribaculaceae bacterium]|nr:hypothetical protein [Muribaculaceae bacterium]